MKYPFQPEILDALPEELAELYRGLEEMMENLVLFSAAHCSGSPIRYFSVLLAKSL